MTSRWQAAPHFRRYGRELVSKPAILLKKSWGGGYRSKSKTFQGFLYVRKGFSDKGRSEQGGIPLQGGQNGFARRGELHSQSGVNSADSPYKAVIVALALHGLTGGPPAVL